MHHSFIAAAVAWACSAGLATAAPTEIEVRIDAQSPGVTLAGTLALPALSSDPSQGSAPEPATEANSGALPAVILITGSGPQDRDSAIFGQRPFAVLARELTARGYAVLRYDDRGTADSTGTFAGSTLDDFTSDARAALDWLKQHEAIDPARVFALGHSEGASVAAALAAEGALTGGAIYLGGTALPGHAVLSDQAVRLMQAAGAPSSMLDAIGPAHRALMQAVLDEADEATLLARTMDLIQAQTPAQIPEEQLRLAAQGTTEALSDPWMRRFLAHNPAQDVAASTVPALALFGSLDMQVSDEANAGPMADALHASGHPGSRVMVLPGLNHLFQRAKTGAMQEYALLPGDLAPEAAQLVADWLDERAPATD